MIDTLYWETLWHPIQSMPDEYRGRKLVENRPKMPIHFPVESGDDGKEENEDVLVLRIVTVKYPVVWSM